MEHIEIKEPAGDVHLRRIAAIDSHMKGFGPRTHDDFLCVQKIAGKIHPGRKL